DRPDARLGYERTVVVRIHIGHDGLAPLRGHVTRVGDDGGVQSLAAMAMGGIRAMTIQKARTETEGQPPTDGGRPRRTPSVGHDASAVEDRDHQIACREVAPQCGWIRITRIV